MTVAATQGATTWVALVMSPTTACMQPSSKPLLPSAWREARPGSHLGGPAWHQPGSRCRWAARTLRARWYIRTVKGSPARTVVGCRMKTPACPRHQYVPHVTVVHPIPDPALVVRSRSGHGTATRPGMLRMHVRHVAEYVQRTERDVCRERTRVCSVHCLACPVLLCTTFWKPLSLPDRVGNGLGNKITWAVDVS